MKTHNWNSLGFYLKNTPVLPRIGPAFSKPIEERVYNTIRLDRPEIDSIDLELIMTYIKETHEKFYLNYDHQMSIARDLLNARKLLADSEHTYWMKIKGTRNRIYNFADPDLLRYIKAEIFKRAESQEGQLITEFIISENRVMPKNYFLKHITRDIHSILMERYSLGPAQASCVIGEIYSAFKIGLTTTIATREQIDSRERSLGRYPDYKSYLIGTIKTYLIP
jgi:hypothetical protein